MTTPPLFGIQASYRRLARRAAELRREGLDVPPTPSEPPKVDAARLLTACLNIRHRIEVAALVDQWRRLGRRYMPSADEPRCGLCKHWRPDSSDTPADPFAVAWGCCARPPIWTGGERYETSDISGPTCPRFAWADMP